MTHVAHDRIEHPQVGAVRVGLSRVRVIVCEARVEAAVAVVRQAQAEIVGLQRDLRDRHAPVGAADADAPVTQLEVLFARLEKVPRDLEQLALDVGRGPRDCPGDHHRVAAAAGPRPHQSLVGVGVGDLDVRRVDRELLGHDLGCHRLRTVAPERRIERHKRFARRVDLDVHALGRAGQREARLMVPEPELGRAEDAALLATRQADADVAALLARLGLPTAPSVVVGHLQRFVQHRPVIPAVVDVAGRDLVGELLGLDEVLPPDFHRADA